MKKIVVMPGGFHPFHAGHYALYQSAKKAFPDADMYVAASDSRTERPFPFQVKQKLAQVAGVKPNEFVQVKSPFRSEEITAKYNPDEDVLIFVRSEKDKTEQPIPGGTKKDGTPAYFQRYNPKDLKPFKQHGYITYLPTVEFAGGIKSATEIRKQWPHLNARQKANMVQALYPNTTGNKKLIDNVVQLINVGMGELTEGDVVSFKRPQLQTIPKELEDAVSDWWQVKDTEDGKYMKASLAQRGIDVEHKDDNMIDDYVMVKWRDGGYRKKGIIKVDDIMEKLINRAYQNPPDDNGPSVAEAYDPYDEADVLLRYDPADKKLKKRSWVHAKLDQAKREGWRYTAEDAMRVHGYFPSKYKQGEFVKKGIDGKWEKIFPYAQRTDERNIWDKIEEDQYWNVGDGQDEPAAGTQPSEELRLKKSHQYAGAFIEGFGSSRADMSDVDADDISPRSKFDQEAEIVVPMGKQEAAGYATNIIGMLSTMAGAWLLVNPSSILGYIGASAASFFSSVLYPMISIPGDLLIRKSKSFKERKKINDSTIEGWINENPNIHADLNEFVHDLIKDTPKPILREALVLMSHVIIKKGGVTVPWYTPSDNKELDIKIKGLLNAITDYLQRKEKIWESLAERYNIDSVSLRAVYDYINKDSEFKSIESRWLEGIKNKLANVPYDTIPKPQQPASQSKPQQPKDYSNINPALLARYKQSKGIDEQVAKIRNMIRESSDEEKEKTVRLHRKLFQLMEEEKNNVIDLNKARDEKAKGQEKRNDVYHEKRKQQERMLHVIQQILFGLHEELGNMMQVDLAPIEFIDFQQEVEAMIDKIENFDANDFPFYDDNGELLEMYKRVKFIKEAWLNSKSHTFESFRNDPILAPMPGGDVDTSGPKVLRPQEFKTKRVGPQPTRFWKVTEKHDYLPEK